MTTYLQLSIVNNDTAIAKENTMINNNNNDDPSVSPSHTMCTVSTAIDDNDDTTHLLYTKHGLPSRLAHESLTQYKQRILQIDTTAQTITEDNTIQKAITFEKAARKSQRESSKIGKKKKGNKKNTSAYKILHRRASESRSAAQSTSLKDRLAAFQDTERRSQSMPTPPTYGNNNSGATTLRGNYSNGSSEEENVKPKTFSTRRLSFSKENNNGSQQRYVRKSTIESLKKQQQDEQNKNQKRPSLSKRPSFNRRASFTRRVSLTKRRSSISRDNSTNNTTTNTNNNNNTLSRQQQSQQHHQ